MHIIKIGNLYLTADGTWTDRQSDALRVQDDVYYTNGGHDTVRVSSDVNVALYPVRAVKLASRANRLR